MASSAYHGNADCKQQMLERLAGLEDAGNWIARPIHWNGEAGSLVGSLLQGEDLDRWVSDFGLPKWLALLLDELLVASPDPREGARAGKQILDAIPVGADLQRAGSRIILALLVDEHDGLVIDAASYGLGEALSLVSGLHRSCVQGDDVPASKWRLVRKTLVALTDTMASDSRATAVGTCVEAAAWDPATSRTTVSDTLRTRLWIMAEKAGEARPPDMTEAEETGIRTLLGQLYADARQSMGDSAVIDVFKLLKEQHPDAYARVKATNAYRNAQARAQWVRGADIVHAVLAA